MNHPRRRWLRIAAWLLGTALVLTAAALLFLTLTAPGRRVTASLIEDVVSDRIPGWMLIGRLERIGIPTVARDLSFFHPNGTVVLHVKRAEIEFDFVALLSGKLVFRRANAAGGTLLLSIDPDGRTSIEAALSTVRSGSAGQESSFHYALRNMEVKTLLLVLKLGGDTTYRIDDVEGTVSVVREPSGTVVDLRGVSGRVIDKIAGLSLRLANVDGWVHGGQPQVLELNARVLVGDGAMRAKVALFDRDETPVEIRLVPLEGVAVTLTALLVYARGLFSEDIDIALGGT